MLTVTLPRMHNKNEVANSNPISESQFCFMQDLLIGKKIIAYFWLEHVLLKYYLRQYFFQNRMHDSIQLFNQLCNSQWFSHTSMIVFLNKKDLFAEKINLVSLKVCFSEYKGKEIYFVLVRFPWLKFLVHYKI